MSAPAAVTPGTVGDGWDDARHRIEQIEPDHRMQAVRHVLARTPLGDFEFGQWSYARHYHRTHPG
ncbi:MULTISPECIES: hypothetical protein [unclassified Gordonia (in: high G+C Gram-positive bacteria)]|uniref:hypothetical protein n=1 Tax=unclassified Gordonia (in: high G+C Gram-positive bacteria) TaxID=2657482 RepID=UPI000815E8BC|nr:MULTISPECIES: hypothetical protein [unclassified Gordonia (in: high G+C Gram-positive bacteria)]SCB86745.1 hypothetical protein GA0061091_102231 [Gordonia sp. v-85]